MTPTLHFFMLHYNSLLGENSVRRYTASALWVFGDRLSAVPAYTNEYFSCRGSEETILLTAGK